MKKCDDIYRRLQGAFRNYRSLKVLIFKKLREKLAQGTGNTW